MKYFLSRILVLSMILLAVLLMTINVQSVEALESSKLYHYLNSDTTYHTLIIGNSRAEHHIDPRYFDVPTFNLAHAGVGITTTSLMVKNLIKRKPPKRIIMNVDRTYLDENIFTSPHRPMNLVSFLGDLEVKSYFVETYGDVLGRLLIVEPRLYSLIVWKGADKLLKSGYVFLFENRYKLMLDNRYRKSGGYVPKSGVKRAMLSCNRMANLNIDNRSVESLNQLILSCERANIELIIVATPSLLESSTDTYNQLLDEPVLNYFDSLSMEENYFDCTHLNSKGADLFTKSFINSLSQ